ASGHQERSIGAEGHAGYFSSVAEQIERHGFRRQVPDLEFAWFAGRPISASSGQTLAVRAECQPIYPFFVPSQRRDFTPAGQVPNSDSQILAARRQPATVRAKDDSMHPRDMP